MEIRKQLFQTFKWALGLHCLFFPLNMLGYLESGEDSAEQQQNVIDGWPQAFLLGLVVLVLWLAESSRSSQTCRSPMPGAS